MKDNRMLTGILIDPELKHAGGRIVEDSLDSFYKLLHCSTIDIVTRTVGGVPVNIVCDEEGALKDNPWISAISSKGEVMLVGALFIVGAETDDGELVSLSEADQRKVRRCIRYGLTRSHPELYPMLGEVEYE